MDPNPEGLLRRLHDRDAEMCVLLQRASLLNRTCTRVIVDDGTGKATEELGSRGALESSLAVVYGCQKEVSRSRRK